MKHIVGFSGGIDSQATALWVRQRFPPEDVILCNSDAGGNEHPITTEFIKSYSRTVFPVVMISPIVADMGTRAKKRIADLGLEPEGPMDFATLAQIKCMFPTTKYRFCTEHLKLNPQRRWISENVHEEYERYSGVRRDESRARLLTPDREYDDFFKCWLNHPVASWTKQQCFDFVRHAGEEINPLYTMGFSRVGCAPCINASKEDIHMWAARFPEMIDKVREWEQRVGRSFFPPGILPGKKWGMVDEVVEWSRTVRGGSQYELPMLEADVCGGVCVSKYGLCE